MTSLSSISSGEEEYFRAAAEKYENAGGASTSEWKTAVRKKKRPRNRSNSDGVLIEKERKVPKFSRSAMKVVFVGINNKNVCRANPVKVVKQIHDLVGKVGNITKERNELIVQCENETQLTKLLQMTELGGIEIKSKRYDGISHGSSTLKGVIHKVDTQITNEEIEDLLKEQNVVQAKRFMKKKNGAWEPTPSVLLTFRGNDTPETVNFLYEVREVDVYRPPPPRCFKCQSFGHIMAHCKGKLRCVRCGGEHAFDDCPNKENPTCFRCGENHSAAFQGCKFFKEAKNIQKIKLEEKISYAQAARAHRTQPKDNTKVDNGVHPQSQFDGQNAIPNPTKPSSSLAGRGETEGNPRSKIPVPVQQRKQDTAGRPRTSTIADDKSLNLILFILMLIKNIRETNDDDDFLHTVIKASRTFLNLDITIDMVKSRLK